MDITQATSRQPLLKAGQVLLGLAFSLASIVLALREVDLASVGAMLVRISPGPLILAVASLLFAFLVRAVRWRLMLAWENPPGVWRAFHILNIGTLFNAFAPARLGELARAYLMGEAQGESRVYVLGTIVVEKVLELTFLVVSIVLVLPWVALPSWVEDPWQFSLLLIGVAIPVVVLLAWYGERLVPLFAWATGWIPSKSFQERLLAQIRLGLASLHVLRNPGRLTGLLGLSLLNWFLGVLTNYLTFFAVGLSLNFAAALLLLVILQLGGSVPSSTGRIGVFHYLTILGLAIFSVPKADALGYAVILHLIVYGSIALLGVAGLWQEKVTWGKLSQAAARFAIRPGNSK